MKSEYTASSTPVTAAVAAAAAAVAAAAARRLNRVGPFSQRESPALIGKSVTLTFGEKKKSSPLVRQQRTQCAGPRTTILRRIRSKRDWRRGAARGRRRRRRATSALTAIPVTTIPQVPSAFYPCPTSPPPPCTLPGPPPFFTTLSACDVINIATQCYYSMYTSLA